MLKLPPFYNGYMFKKNYAFAVPVFVNSIVLSLNAFSRNQAIVLYTLQRRRLSSEENISVAFAMS